MRLLCDANLGSRFAFALSAAGHDVLRSIHAVGQAASDTEVLSLAVATRRVLLTCDSDFGELVFLKGAAPPPGIVYIRFEPQAHEDVVQRVLDALELGQIDGHMVVIGDTGNRSTPFPVRNRR